MSAELQQKLRESLSYNEETGEFTWLVKGSIRSPKGSKAGTVNKCGYVVFRFDGKLQYAHRMAWVYMTGNMPAAGIDHRDGARANNQWVNLREATQAENNQNSPLTRGGRKIPAGVDFYKALGRWRARIRKSNKEYSLGLFDTMQEAHEAYKSAKQHLHTFNPILREA